jgi:DNA primase
MVSKDKQIWHCFGCGEGGDIFGFVMKMEGLEFPEALRVLAKKAGVQLRYQDPALQSQKTKLLDICRSAVNFYHTILLEHPKAKFVREYLATRQIKDETIETWQLGYAPDAWETLVTYLLQKKYKEEDIFLAGLTIKKEKGVGYYDRFRHRLMFPINDVHGNIIGFGGRWLGDEKDAQAAKYINSPQTLVYDKSRVLFGLDKAKTDIKQQKLVVVVEGYMDCLASHQAGVTNVVASSGTALTSEQVRMIKRYTTNIAFAFDQDTAGESASKRGIDVAMREEMNIKVIQLPFGKDPDELIKKDAHAWSKAIADSRSIMDYYFTSTLARADLSKVEDKKLVARVLLGIIAKLVDPIEQTHYLQKLAAILTVEESVLRDKLKQLTKKKLTPSDMRAETAVVRGDRYVALAESLIGLGLQHPEQLNYISGQLLPEHVPASKLQELYKKAITYYTEKQTFDYQDFVKSMPPDERRLATYADILTMRVEEDYGEMDDESIVQAIRSGSQELKRHYIQQALKSIEQKIRLAEQQHDEALIERYTHEFSALTGELKYLEE